MKKIFFLLAAVAFFSFYHNVAHATSIVTVGYSARDVINAFRMANVTFDFDIKGNVYNIEVKNLKCVIRTNSALDAEEFLFSMPSYQCNLPNARTEAHAKVVLDSLINIVRTDSGMGQTWLEAEKITCKVNATETDVDKRFRCEITQEN